MKGVFLDSDTLGSISFEPLENLPIEWTFYKMTSPEETLERIKEADVVVTNKVFIGKEAFFNTPDLKLICVAATGYNNIDMAAAKQYKIPICNVPAYSTPSVVQLVMAFIFSFAFNLTSYVGDVKKGIWQTQSQFCFLTYPIMELQRKKLGIIGHGTLGKQVALLAQSMGMHTLIASRPGKTQIGTMALNQVLSESDFLTLHVPLTQETENLISRLQIEQMKPTSFLINTARGGIVNEKDLAECLIEKRIAGAAIDVLTTEPPKNSNPLLDPSIPNLLITPHIGWASKESRERLVEALKGNIQSFLQGKPKNLCE